jgi:two-component sensor histidine kinase
MKILHLEDSDDDAKLICDALSREVIAHHVTRVETREAFLEAMDHGDWDIILSDYSLPSFDGSAALKLAVEKRPDLPFIFVTGALGEELAVETLRNGATDYILKHRLHRLPQAVARARRESESAKARKEAERQLKTSLHEKELLLQEVHHRVNNNLQVICSLLSMQSDAVTDLHLASGLRESQKRVQAMAMIYAMFHASSSLQDIDFAEYAHMLAADVATSCRIDPARIQLVFKLEPIRLEIDRAIPCGLILNELLANVFKYAFPNGRSGEVRVSLQQRERCIRLAVEDTGIGLRARRSLGKSEALALNIVNALTKQLGGSMEITSKAGAHFVLSFARSADNQ